MPRTDIRNPVSQAAFTVSATVSVGLTVPGQSGQSIYLTYLSVTYDGAQTGVHLVKIFDGATEVFRFAGNAGLQIPFYSPLALTPGNNLVVTCSVSVNTINGLIAVTYYRE